jgi:excisionase family DNA binding protein
MLLTAKEVAAEYRLHLSTVYAWAKAGKIPCKRLNGQYRFERHSLDSWYDSCPSAALEPMRVPEISKAHHTDVDALIASVKREVYTAGHGETRPKSGLIRKEEQDGAVQAA